MVDAPDPRTLESRERTREDARGPEHPGDVFMRGLDLPHGHDREYALRGSEVRALATVGAFRVVAADDLRDDRGREGDLRHGELERLRDAGLIRSVAPLDRTQRTAVVTLTERGRELLEQHRTVGYE